MEVSDLITWQREKDPALVKFISEPCHFPIYHLCVLQFAYDLLNRFYLIKRHPIKIVKILPKKESPHVRNRVFWGGKGRFSKLGVVSH